MELTAAAVIGRNVKTRREARGMTAKSLGVRMGELFREDGKPWPPQAVYMLEAGDRAMVAAEVVALAEVLGVRVADLFAPPVDVDTVAAGTLRVPAERLAAPIGTDPAVEALGRAFKVVELARGRIAGLAEQQRVALMDARAALRGDDPAPAPDGESPADVRDRVAMEAAEGLYAEADQPRPALRDLRDLLDDVDGEG